MAAERSDRRGTRKRAAPQSKTAEKSKGGRPAFEPTAEQRKTVAAMVAYGIPHADIARIIGDGIDAKTLRKHFRDEIDTSAPRANAKVGEVLFRKATVGIEYTEQQAIKCKREYYDDRGKKVVEERVEMVDVVRRAPPDSTLMMFWMKCRAGWKDTTVQEHTGRIETIERRIVKAGN